MAVVLEGGCRVSTMHEGTPRVLDSLKVWDQIGIASGAEAISLRILEFGPGRSPDLQNREGDEVIYVLEGDCTVFIDDIAYDVSPETGIYVRPEQRLSVNNTGADVVQFLSA